MRRCIVQTQARLRKALRATTVVVTVLPLLVGSSLAGPGAGKSDFVEFKSPAGELPTLREFNVAGYQGAILPNGRLITPAGGEVNVDAPKPFGMALSTDGKALATINSGASRFSVTLIRNPADPNPQATRIDVNATFLGVTFSQDGSRLFASGGENGNSWVGDTAAAKIIGSVNLNGPSHPLDRPLSVVDNPAQRFKGTFPGQIALTSDGNHLYVVDQGGFSVYVVD